MKRLAAAFFLFVGLVTIGCQKSGRAEKNVRAGMSADMSDEQLLRTMKLDPKKMAAKEARGPDGTSFVYSDDEEEVSITRSSFSGVAVLRHLKKKDVWQTWMLGKP